MLRETGLNPHLLKFEITESAVMGDAEAAVATTAAVEGIGGGAVDRRLRHRLLQP